MYVTDRVRRINRRPRNMHARKDVICLKVTNERSHRTRSRVDKRSAAWTVLTSPLRVSTVSSRIDSIRPGLCDHLRCHSEHIDPLGSGKALLNTRNNSARLTSAETTAARHPPFGNSPRRLLCNSIGSHGERTSNSTLKLGSWLVSV